MRRDIRSEGFAGAALFEYTDEWFKLSWKTADAEQPTGRRQLWINDLTNEEHFGLVAAEPGARPVATLDGIDTEWSRNGSQVVAESNGPVREVRVTKDEEFLWLRLRLERPSSWRTMLWVQEPDRRVSLIGERSDHVAGLLCGPDAGRIRGHARDVRPARGELDEDEHVQAAQQHGIDGEEVARDDPGRLRAQERAPALRCAVRGWIDSRPLEDRP